MRTISSRSLRATIVAASMLLAIPVSAQRVDPTRLFDLTVSSSGEIMTVSIREGGDFRLTVAQRDEYRFVPIAPAGRRTITMAVYHGTAGQPTSSRIVERLELSIGVPATLRTSPNISLVVDRVRSVPRVAQAPSPGPISFTAAASWRRTQGPDQCCVCCGVNCACACGVQMSCGSCCMGECCGRIKPTSGPGAPEAERNARVAAFLGVESCSRVFPATAGSAFASR